jgi:hypothetical protein
MDYDSDDIPYEPPKAYQYSKIKKKKVHFRIIQVQEEMLGGPV